jgi:hypothetical protein
MVTDVVHNYRQNDFKIVPCVPDVFNHKLGAVTSSKPLKTHASYRQRVFDGF